MLTGHIPNRGMGTVSCVDDLAVNPFAKEIRNRRLDVAKILDGQLALIRRHQVNAGSN
jgi:hypothetical protein